MENNFIIGIYGADIHVTENEWGNVIPESTITISGKTYNSSWFNILKEDGFNLAFIYRPDIWDTFDRLKNLFKLIKNNNIKLIDCNRFFYKPNKNDSGGVNQYNLTNHNDKATCNYDQCYDNVYNDISVSNNIVGHFLGGEFNYNHSYPLYDTFPEMWCDNCNNEYYKRAEIPPQNVSDALAHFFTKRNSLPNTKNQKVIYNAAAHGGFIEGFYESPQIYKPEDYVKMEGVTNLQKPDIFDEGSYFSNQFLDWDKSDGIQSDGTIYPWPRRYYLGKFKSIDFAKKYFNKILSEVDFELNINNPEYIYSIHSNPLVPNANHVWFQTYTSIIHGSIGVVFYDLNSAWIPNDAEDNTNKIISNTKGLATRFNREYFPKNYKLYISNLSKELAYLVNKNLLSDDPNSIIMNKTNVADTNKILSSSTTYLPTTVSAIDSRDFSAVNNKPLSTTYKNKHRDEEYGIRYTIRTNGSEVIMIASNPNPYSVHNVKFDFINVTNSIIRSAKSVEVLFDDGSVRDVNSYSYKTSRSDTVNFSNTEVLKKYDIPLYYMSFSTDFCPFDVKVFKFSTKIVPTTTTTSSTKPVTTTTTTTTKPCSNWLDCLIKFFKNIF